MNKQSKSKKTSVKKTEDAYKTKPVDKDGEKVEYPDDVIIVGKKDISFYLRAISKVKKGKLFFPWRYTNKIRDLTIFIKGDLKISILDLKAYTIEGIQAEFELR